MGDRVAKLKPWYKLVNGPNLTHDCMVHSCREPLLRLTVRGHVAASTRLMPSIEALFIARLARVRQVVFMEVPHPVGARQNGEMTSPVTEAPDRGDGFLAYHPLAAPLSF